MTVRQLPGALVLRRMGVITLRLAVWVTSTYATMLDLTSHSMRIQM